MARNTKIITITDEGRDQNKTFLITEMPALSGQRWAIRMIFAIAKGGVEMPEGFEHLGFAALAQLGLILLLKAPIDLIEPLLDEMMSCVQFCPNEKDLEQTRKLFESDIDEIRTYFQLRKAIWDLHIQPFTSGGQ